MGDKLLYPRGLTPIKESEKSNYIEVSPKGDISIKILIAEKIREE